MIEFINENPRVIGLVLGIIFGLMISYLIYDAERTK